MADKTSNKDFQATIQNLGGDSYSADLPAYVLDKTLRDVMEGLVKAVSAASKENSKGLEDLAKEYKTALGKSDKSNKEATEDLGEKQEKAVDDAIEKRMKQADRIANQENKDRDKYQKEVTVALQTGAEKGARVSSDLIFSAIKGMAVLFGTAGGILVNSFSNLGSSLRTLTDTGQAFGDQLGAGTSSTVDNIVKLNQLGLTTEEAVAALSTYARAMSSMGQSNLIDLNKQFLIITDNGRNLGVTLDEASEFFLQDQQFRARTLNKDRIDQTITAQLTMQSIQNLRGFSSILGQSTDAIRQQSEGIIDGNAAFKAFTNTLTPGKATEMQAVGKSLVDGLIAIFPEQGGELGNALLSVAGTGVGAITQFANMLAPLGGEFYTEFQNLASGLRSGTIGMEDVESSLMGIVTASANNVDNLEQLSIISGLEGHAMADVAKMVIQMQQDANVARERLQKLASGNDMEFDQIQKVTTGFQNILKTLRGGYSSLLNSIPIAATKELGTNFDALLNTFSGTGGVSVLTTELNRAGREIGKAVGETLNALAGDDGFATTISTIVDGIIRISTDILDRITRIIKSFEQNGKIDFIGAMGQFIKESIGAFFTLVAEAFMMVPWGEVLPVGAIIGAFVLATSAITAAFSAAAFVAGQAFAAAAAGVGIGGMFGGGKFKGAGKFLKGTAVTAGIIGGGAAIYNNVTAPRETEYEKKKANRGIMGTIGGIVAGLGLMALVVGTGGIAAAPLAAAAAAGGGAYLGNKFGTSEFVSGKKPQNEQRKQAQITSPSMQGPVTSSVSMRYLDSMTETSSQNQSAFSPSEINKLDKETPETKALALILAENKRLTRQVQSLINDGLKTIPKTPNRGA